jgi:WD40 repeat protein/subtilisin-like proprotein convertase family protein
VVRQANEAEFFVVGGPVQADRACYIARAADEALEQAIRDQHFSYVLGPRATGKTSLMARTVRRLRSEGQLAAVVDLTQIGARSETADAGRWYYSIAYRILRELRLKVDLQSWWQEKSTLMSEQRLAEFFLELVLSHTSVPVTVCFDEIERVHELPFADQLFAAIRTCYARRATEPDYARLNFVVLGVATATELCPDSSLSPFSDGVAINLPDFTLEQTYALEAGFTDGRAHARAALDRIYGWARGQPYLTQKLARGTVRRGGQTSDVDRALKERFLAPGVAREEPLLSHMRAMLTQRGPHNRQALLLLSRIARRLQVDDEPGSRACMLLKLSGVASADSDGRLDYRNRIFRHVFDSRWIRTVLPFNWRAASLAAAAAFVAGLLSVWYMQYLPQPYVASLVAAGTLAEAEEAHRRLGRFPGHRNRADVLLESRLRNWAEHAAGVPELFAFTEALRRLPSREPLADRLMAHYWLGRAREEMRVERRDNALLYASQALTGADEEAGQLAAELIGSDFRNLLATIHLPAGTARWTVDWDEERLMSLDGALRVHSAALEPRSPAMPAPDLFVGRSAPVAFTALQQVPLRRELSVDEPGPAGALSLELAIDHAQPADVELLLEAPDGTAVPLMLDSAAIDDAGRHVFDTTTGNGLETLADVDRQGVWRLTVTDRRVGHAGMLSDWGLRFADTESAVLDRADQAIVIPDPQRTDQVELTMDPRGRIAAVRTLRPAAGGGIALWNVVDGALLADIHVDTMPQRLQFVADGSRLIAYSDRYMEIREVPGGDLVARRDSDSGFLLPPAISTDGAYVIVAEWSDLGVPLLALLRTDNGAAVSTVSGYADVQQWVLASQARYLALMGPGRSVRILDPRRGELLTELRHEREFARVAAIPGEDRVITVDRDGLIHVWPVGSRNVEPQPQALLGTTRDSASLIVARTRPMIAFEAPQGHVVVRDLDHAVRSTRLRVERSGEPLAISIADDARRLVTGRGSTVRLWELQQSPFEVTPEADDLTALALDDQGRFAALGFRGGNVIVRSASALERGPTPDMPVDYIGHRGAVTSLAVATEHSLVVSGGMDGAVRLWDLASVAPAAQVMRHPRGSVHAVAISGDGRRVVSGGDDAARVWRIFDGAMTAEIPVNGAAVGVAFAPDATVLAIGDSAGNVYIGDPGGAMAMRSARAQGAVRALAFTPDGSWLASGDDAGSVQLWDALTLEPVGQPHAFRQPVKWLRFAPDGLTLLVQTDHWIHRVATDAAQLRVLDSRLPALGVEAGAAPLTLDGMRLRLIAGRESGRLVLHDLDMDHAPAPPADFDAAILQRDWAAVLGLTIGPLGRIHIGQ